MSGRGQTPKPKHATLQMPRAEVESRLNVQIKKGRALLAREIATKSELESARKDMWAWSEYNEDLLSRIVDTDELRKSYASCLFIGLMGRTTLREDVDEYRRDVRHYLDHLESILGRLELIPEPPEVTHPPEQAVASARPTISNRVFVVHGHDEEAKQTVARYLEKLDLEAIILHEQPNKGRTIIEKFEDYADVGFAVVLLTPDDVGSAKDKTDNPVPRARQNVVFELGFFVGRLGRQRVCALHKGDVEIPTDFAGVLWVPMDSNAWRLPLGQEMKAAGLDVDLNKLA